MEEAQVESQEQFRLLDRIGKRNNVSNRAGYVSTAGGDLTQTLTLFLLSSNPLSANTEIPRSPGIFDYGVGVQHKPYPRVNVNQ